MQFLSIILSINFGDLRRTAWTQRTILQVGAVVLDDVVHDGTLWSG
jgi:hypothetical protein